MVGLDIGTTKICTLIAKVKEKGDFEVVGIGKAPSRGLSKGVVINIKKTSEVVEKSVRRAEFDAGLKVRRAWVSIAGAHIQGRDNRGLIKIEKEDRVITPRDVEMLLKDASRLILPANREIIHVLPQEFLIDDQDQIKEPVGMRGARLEAKVHIITASSSHRRNIEESLRQAGYEPEGVVLQSLASGMATLSPEEQNLGVVLLDIGGGTTDIAVISLGEIVVSNSLRIGGDKLDEAITRYIRKHYNLAIGENTAEYIKQKIGYAISPPESEEMEIKGRDLVAGLPQKIRISAKEISESLSEPLSFIVGGVKEVLAKTPPELSADIIEKGIVLTGGGSLLKNLDLLIARTTGICAYLAEGPLFCVAIGAGRALENIELLERTY